MAFGTPNIFVDISNMIQGTATPYIVATPTQFVESVRTILSRYPDAVVETKLVADLFFTPAPEKHFKEFFANLKLL
jgi:hypothetical protein